MCGSVSARRPGSGHGDLMAAKRGQCPVCRYRFRLRRNGTLQAHHLYSGSDRNPRACEGSGEMPVSAMGRIEDAFGQIRGEMQAVRLSLALWRDCMLTEAEQIAMLDVYAEFGR